MVIDLVDGTYELFRHFHGLRRFTRGQDRPFGAVAGVLRRTSAWPGCCCGRRTRTWRNACAARLLNRHGPIEAFPPGVLGEAAERALRFKRLATLRTDATLFGDVGDLRWRGPTDAFAGWARQIDAPRLLERYLAAQGGLQAG